MEVGAGDGGAPMTAKRDRAVHMEVLTTSRSGELACAGTSCGIAIGEISTGPLVAVAATRPLVAVAPPYARPDAITCQRCRGTGDFRALAFLSDPVTRARYAVDLDILFTSEAFIGMGARRQAMHVLEAATINDGHLRRMSGGTAFVEIAEMVGQAIFQMFVGLRWLPMRLTGWRVLVDAATGWGRAWKPRDHAFSGGARIDLGLLVADPGPPDYQDEQQRAQDERLDRSIAVVRNNTRAPIPFGSAIALGDSRGGGALANCNGGGVFGLLSGDFDAAAGAEMPVIIEGTLRGTVGQWAIITGDLFGLVPGERYFVHPTRPGRLCSATRFAQITQQLKRPWQGWMLEVGTAIADNDLRVAIQPPFLLPARGRS